MNKRQKKKNQKKRLEKIKSLQCLEGAEAEAEAVKETKREAETLDNATVKRNVVGYMYIPITILFLEIVLLLAHGGSLFSVKGLYITLFSFAYGLVIQLLTLFIKKPVIRLWAMGGVLFFAGLLYTVIYFLYCEFQVFYDLNTMLAGAYDAATHFSGDIVSIVCSLDGFMHLVLFFLPFILFVLFHKKLFTINVSALYTKAITGFCAIACIFVAVILLGTNSLDKDTYGALYSYDSAVKSFGLLTGIRLEIKNSVFPQTEGSDFEFVNVEAAAISNNGIEYEDAIAVSEDAATALATVSSDEAELIIGDNVLDIDFEELAKKDGGAFADLDAYVASVKPTNKNKYTGLFKGKNLIFLTAEAFTNEAIREDLTPTLYRLATKGFQFTDYYQPASAGTTGGEYSNIFGMLPSLGGKSLKETATHYNWNTIGARLNEEGYYGKVYHNNDYKYYDRHKTHVNLGYSDGYEGYGNGLESIITKQWPQSDLEMLKGTFLKYVDKQPFNIYYMTVSGHSLYSFAGDAMAKKHEKEVLELDYSEPVKSYLAANIELEEGLKYIVDELEKRNMEKDTVIVIGADHFPYGLDQDSGKLKYLSELYGKDVKNNLERDHNRLIIWSGCLEDEEPVVISDPTSSIDILPTLMNLFGVSYDSRMLPGRDVFSDAQPLVYTMGYEWKTDKGSFYYGQFHRANENEEISEEYVKNISAIVKNKSVYSKGVLQRDYFRHVFGSNEENQSE